MRKLLVAGDRNWDNPALITKVLRFFQEMGYDTVVEGGALGADKQACTSAQFLDMLVLEFPARWEDLGRAAGPLRNQEMLDKNSDIEIVLAFHDDLNKSRGTRDMVKRALAKGLTVIRFNSQGEESLVVGL